MPKVKIVITEYRDTGDYSGKYVITEGLSDWEEVTNEELSLLRNYRHIIPVGSRDGHATLVVQDDVPVSKRIDSIREYITNTTKRMEADKAKSAAAAQARKAQKAERERLRYEKLKEKFDGK